MVNGRRGKITSERAWYYGTSKPYKVTFDNGKESGWLYPNQVTRAQKDTVISSSAVDVEMAGGRTASYLDVKQKDDAPGSIPPSSPTSSEFANAPEGSSIELTEIKRSPPTDLPLDYSEISNSLASFFNPFSPKSPAMGRADVFA